MRGRGRQPTGPASKNSGNESDVADEQPDPRISRPIVVLISDLFFETRIRETARQLGVAIRVISAADDLADVFRDASGLVVDLNLSTADALDVLRRVKSEFAALPIVAFCAHVQTELIAQASEAGADRVLPRSTFTEQLPQILRELSAPD